MNVHKTVTKPEPSQQNDSGPRAEKSDEVAQNPDLRRAMDLVKMHNEINSKHHHDQDGDLEEDLRKARQEVNGVLKQLDAAEKR